MQPTCIQAGDELRIIAPSRSIAIVKGEQRRLAEERLTKLGFTLTYGETALVHDHFFSNSIADRMEDLHTAFKDEKVKGILAGIGGYNANQLLQAIDYDLIKSNPKPICGFGDITSILLAIYAKTSVQTYLGPFSSTFGAKHGLDYTIEFFKKALMQEGSFELQASETWNDDSWHLELEERQDFPNHGHLVIQEGEAEGTIIAGNLSSMSLLHGTEYMPSLKNSILFLEDNDECHPFQFDRLLQSLLYQPEADGIKAIVLGRFQKDSGMTEYALQEILTSKKELQHIPIIANANFGHTNPMATIPIGAQAAVQAKSGMTYIEIKR